MKNIINGFNEFLKDKKKEHKVEDNGFIGGVFNVTPCTIKAYSTFKVEIYYINRALRISKKLSTIQTSLKGSSFTDSNVQKDIIPLLCKELFIICDTLLDNLIHNTFNYVDE